MARLSARYQIAREIIEEHVDAWLGRAADSIALARAHRGVQNYKAAALEIREAQAAIRQAGLLADCGMQLKVRL